MTSTYFEGQAEKNPQAQRGYSRDHRPDCKQVNIALVVSRCGMPLGYELFAGNRHDSTTLEEIVEHIEGLYGRANRIWVMDRGMAGEDNVKFLREGGGATSSGRRRTRCASSNENCWPRTGSWCMKDWKCASRRLRAERKSSFWSKRGAAGQRAGHARTFRETHRGRPAVIQTSCQKKKQKPCRSPALGRSWGATRARRRCLM